MISLGTTDSQITVPGLTNTTLVPPPGDTFTFTSPVDTLSLTDLVGGLANLGSSIIYTSTQPGFGPTNRIVFSTRFDYPISSSPTYSIPTKTATATLSITTTETSIQTSAAPAISKVYEVKLSIGAPRRRLPQGAIAAKVQRRVTEAKWTETGKWWKAKFKNKKTVYRLNKKRRIHKLLGQVKKKIAGRYLQLKVGHTLMGVFLKHIKKKESQECWWCGHKRQTRDHLFMWCKKWKRQQDDLWKELRKIPISQVFDMDEAVKAVLKFFKKMDVGRVLGVLEGREEEG
ncbi:hypothetical protein BDD12DRAFT_913521 [Trichophaea hybrida]|nr:hypothetical protein BDD12DRAFT_913521 [Trichophaea hybrida]